MVASSAIRFGFLVIVASAVAVGVGRGFSRSTPVSSSVLAATHLSHRPAPSNALRRTDEPGGTRADHDLAMRNPDEYAWDLFFFINRQASLKGGDPAGSIDTAEADFTQYDPNQPVVWETWALASSEEDSELYGCSGGNREYPLKWEKLARPETRGKLDDLSPNLAGGLATSTNSANLVHENRANQRAPQMTYHHYDFEHPRAEVRFNKDMYEGIRTRNLWNQEGILKAIKVLPANKDSFLPDDFSAKAKAIKADWIPLTDPSQYSRYHWRIDGQVHMGLAALHIMTRDIHDNWFWADFIHTDCLAAQTPANPCKNVRGTIQTVDTTTGNSVRPETIGSKWENYRLTGAQNSFMRDATTSVILADPMLDPTLNASCMTCHSMAATGPRIVPQGSGDSSLDLFDTSVLQPKYGKPPEFACGVGAQCTPETKRLYYRTGASYAMVNSPRSIHSGCMVAPATHAAAHASHAPQAHQAVSPK